MPFITSPLSLHDLDGFSHKSYSRTLRQYLNTQLLEHRKEAGKISLAGFEGEATQTVEVTFGAPRRQMDFMAKRVADAFGMPEGGEQAMKDIADRTIDEFIADNKDHGWTHTAQQGDTMVVFREAIGDDTHPANKYAGQPDGKPFEHASGFAAINGRSVTLSHRNLLQNSLPNIANWMDSVRTVEADGILNFAPTVVLNDEDNAAISTTKTLHIGGNLLRDTQDKGVMIDILRHERGHAVNGDLDTNMENPRTRAYSQTLEQVESISTALEQLQHYMQKPGLIESADFGEDSALIRKLGNTLQEVMDQLPALNEHIRHYPWFDEMTPLSVAADLHEQTGLLEHLTHAPTVDSKPLVTAMRDLRANAMRHPPQKSILDEQRRRRDPNYERANWPDLRSALKRQLNRITPEQQGAFDGVDEAYQQVSKAREYLADVHAAQHSEDPTRVKNVFENFKELGMEVTGGRTHPDTQERTEVAGHFARRVLHQRQQAAEQRGNGQSR